MLFTLLFIFWVVLNGRITLEIVLIGLFLSAVVTRFSHKTTRFTKEHEKKFMRKVWKIIKYLSILLLEIVRCNIQIIKLVLTKNPEISPTLKTINIDLNSRIAKVALANSITLPPGTISVSMNEDQILIHAIRKSDLDRIENSIFIKMLKELEE